MENTGLTMKAGPGEKISVTLGQTQKECLNTKRRMLF